ncbi:MAG: carbonic anhydrase [Alphaproteobacteria bacterium]|nr:carbonic anhydrase [Alphaproteobacteria bacterium]
MTGDALAKLVEGYREFREGYVGKQYAAYRSWASKAQNPRVMMIACSDSRVNPAILTHAGLGEVFMVNNVANLVPPYKEGKDTHHSTSAALEFAVCHLQVEHVVVLGHSRCGGIRALMEGITCKHDEPYSFIEPWVNIAREAKDGVLVRHAGCSPEEQAHFCEKEALRISLHNLDSFPWVRAAKAQRGLQTHAWYFDVGNGDMERYDAGNDSFIPLLGTPSP